MNIFLVIGPALLPLALAITIDLLLGEPPARFHPVVWMGKFIQQLEQFAPAEGGWQQFLYGVMLTIAGVIIFAGLPWFVLGLLPPLVGIVLSAALLKTTFSGKLLWQAALQVEKDLRENNIVAARVDLRSLVSRDTATLPRPLLTAAAIESVAENVTDSIVSPLFAYSVFGLPGAIAYRYANTCDSMIGYHTIRYEFLGKFAARLDDLLNFIPARLTGLLIVAATFLMRGNGERAWKIMWRDHGLAASPNAGWTMAAMAGALGVRLEKEGHYRLGAEFPEPDTFDIARAVRIMRIAYAISTGMAALAILLRLLLTGALAPATPSISLHSMQA